MLYSHTLIMLHLRTTFFVFTFFCSFFDGTQLSDFEVGAVKSYSGPTNHLWGHEELVDEVPRSRAERVKRGLRWQWNYQPSQSHYNYNYQYNYNYNLLVSSESPNDYMRMFLTSEHNKYRATVSFVCFVLGRGLEMFGRGEI